MRSVMVQKDTSAEDIRQTRLENAFVPMARINVIFRGPVSKVSKSSLSRVAWNFSWRPSLFGGEVDKVHHIIDRHFHNGFAQF